MKSYRETALVLECFRLGEADQIITLFTKNKGLVRAVAKGVRRTKSKFGGKLQLFSIIEVQIYPGKNLSTITQVESIVTLGPLIVDDMDKYYYANAIIEFSRKILGEEFDPNSKLFNLTVRALRSITLGKIPSNYTYVSFLLFALQAVGWKPNFNKCNRCSSFSDEIYTNKNSKNLHCYQCVKASRNNLLIDEVLNAYYLGDWDFLDHLDEEFLKNIEHIIQSYILNYLNINLVSLNTPSQKVI